MSNILTKISHHGSQGIVSGFVGVVGLHQRRPVQKETVKGPQNNSDRKKRRKCERKGKKGKDQ
jgi:hypothetical protein